MKDNDNLDFPALSAADPVKDWKRWKRDLCANLQAMTDESGTNPMDHLFDRDKWRLLLRAKHHDDRDVHD